MLSLRKSGKVAKTLQEQLDIRDCLDNKLKSPFSKSNFKQHLAKNLAVESLEFYEAVNAYKNGREKKKTKVGGLRRTVQNVVRPSSVVEEAGGEEKLLAHQLEIREQFITVGSKDEINLSSAQRDKIEVEIEESQKNMDPDPTIFDEAVDEVVTLMERGHFSDFIYLLAKTNLTERARAGFFTFGYGLVLIFLIFEAAIFSLLLLEEDVIDDNHVFLRMIPMPFLMIGLGYVFGYHYNTCPLLACMRKQMQVDDEVSYIKILCSSQSRRIDEEYEVFRKMYLQRGVSILVNSSLLSVGVSIILMIIPPGLLQDL